MREAQTRATKQSRWLVVVDDYRKSGLSIKAFPQQLRINLYNLRCWLKKQPAMPELRPSSLFVEARGELLSATKNSSSESIVLAMASVVRLEI